MIVLLKVKYVYWIEEYLIILYHTLIYHINGPFLNFFLGREKQALREERVSTGVKTVIYRDRTIRKVSSSERKSSQKVRFSLKCGEEDL